MRSIRVQLMTGLCAAVLASAPGLHSSFAADKAASSPASKTVAPVKSAGGPEKVAEKSYKTTASGLKYAIVKEGAGAEARAGQTVNVQYTGWLKSNGEKFDSSYDHGQPFSFSLGAGQVIKGWDEGVQGMKIGEKRQLVIPPELGYGERGTPGGPIPPKATLVFDVELVSVS